MSSRTIIAVRQGDVTKADVDVLVNASNTAAWLGSGVSGAIRRACGPGFQDEISRELEARFGESMEPAGVMVTGAGAHPRARYVAHVAVMDYRPGHERDAAPDEGRILRASVALWRALEALPEARLSVGMVALGAGTGALGVRVPTTIACETLRDHLASEPNTRIERVVFHGYELHEVTNVLHVVRRFFPVDEGALSQDLREYVDRLPPDEA